MNHIQIHNLELITIINCQISINGVLTRASLRERAMAVYSLARYSKPRLVQTDTQHPAYWHSLRTIEFAQQPCFP